jgi:A/G-specific adenine glycosylase
MTSRAVGYALVLRNGLEVLLEQRGAAHTVMPGLWELPSLLDPVVPEADLRMTVRHAIMQVNYSVRVRTVCEDEVASLTAPGGYRRWVTVADAGPMALTGLTRKILTRAQLLGPADLRARPHLEW